MYFVEKRILLLSSRGASIHKDARIRENIFDQSLVLKNRLLQTLQEMVESVSELYRSTKMQLNISRYRFQDFHNFCWGLFSSLLVVNVKWWSSSDQGWLTSSHRRATYFGKVSHEGCTCLHIYRKGPGGGDECTRRPLFTNNKLHSQSAINKMQRFTVYLFL